MFAKRYTWTIIFFFVVTTVTALENYMDYGTGDVSSNDIPNLRDLIRFRDMLETRSDRMSGFGGLSSEKLQPAERSPTMRLRFGRSFYTPKYPRSSSLRLRFGRSLPVRPYDLLSRLNSGSSAAAGASLQQQQQQDN